MKIKTKILWTLLSMSLLVALVGALAVNRQHAAAMVGVTKEAENVARVVGFLFMPDSNRPSTISAQEIVDKLHQTLRRDVSVVDTNQLILADAVPTAVGKFYTDDSNDEIGSTIRDGQVRTFVEVSQEYPAGIKQIVVPIEGQSGQAVGAVILEYSPLYDELMQLTRNTIRQLVLAGLGSVAFALLIAFYMGRSIARPLDQLTIAATGFAAGRTDLPMPPPRKDEIGQLATAFNDMVQKRRQTENELRRFRHELEMHVVDRTRELAQANAGLQAENTERKLAEAALTKAHKELVDASRQAGRAEFATGILHNVGNVLNSVNVASSCLAASLRNSKAANLSKVVTMLSEHEGDLGSFLTGDAKGKQLPGYLAKLAAHLAGEREDALQELAQLQKNIEHIKAIVTQQQSSAKGAGQMETLTVTDLVEDALRMESGGQINRDMQVMRQFEAAPLITVDKHKALQILMNLVRNARQACDEAGGLEKRLTLRITNGEECVRIAVSDNGAGIAPESLSRIFSHGFTTKKDGHGFGLPSAWAAAGEMGGSLQVQSDGRGRGATFILELPNKTNPSMKIPPGEENLRPSAVTRLPAAPHGVPIVAVLSYPDGSTGDEAGRSDGEVPPVTSVAPCPPTSHLVPTSSRAA